MGTNTSTSAGLLGKALQPVRIECLQREDAGEIFYYKGYALHISGQFSRWHIAEGDPTGIDLFDINSFDYCEPELTDCAYDTYLEGGLDNTLTNYRHTNQVFTVTLSNDTEEETAVFTIASATGWTDQVQQMAAGLTSIMPWAITVGSFHPTGGGGLPQPLVVLNQMQARYAGFQVCPADKVPARVTYVSDQQTEPIDLVVQYIQTPIIYLDRCFDKTGTLRYQQLDGTPYVPVCPLPCYVPVPTPPQPKCTITYQEGCDNLNQQDTANFISIVRTITNCEGEAVKVKTYIDVAGELEEYTVVGEFVDCATGELLSVPVILDELSRDEICINGSQNGWLVTTINSEGIKVEHFEDETGVIPEPADWVIGSCSAPSINPLMACFAPTDTSIRPVTLYKHFRYDSAGNIESTYYTLGDDTVVDPATYLGGGTVTSGECQLHTDCWFDTYFEGGLDNTLTNFRHTGQVYTVTLSNGLEERVETFTVPSATGWTDQVQQMADGLATLMPWAITVDSFHVTGAGGLPAPAVTLDEMLARYVGFQVCPADLLPKRVQYVSDQQTTPVDLVVQYIQTPIVYLDRCYWKDGSIYTEKDTTTVYEPKCALPCGTEVPKPPAPSCKTQFQEGCDNLNQGDSANFVPVTRAIQNCEGELATSIYSTDVDGELEEYTLVGEFVDCASGVPLEVPVVLDEKIRSEICIDGYKMGWLVSEINTEGVTTEYFEDETGVIPTPKRWKVGCCSCSCPEGTPTRWARTYEGVNSVLGIDAITEVSGYDDILSSFGCTNHPVDRVIYFQGAVYIDRTAFPFASTGLNIPATQAQGRNILITAMNQAVAGTGTSFREVNGFIEVRTGENDVAWVAQKGLIDVNGDVCWDSFYFIFRSDCDLNISGDSILVPVSNPYDPLFLDQYIAGDVGVV